MSSGRGALFVLFYASFAGLDCVVVSFSSVFFKGGAAPLVEAQLSAFTRVACEVAVESL